MKRKTKSKNENGLASFRNAESTSAAAAKRVTLSPKFLTLNILSGTARKNNCYSASNSLEKENSYDIFDGEPSRMKANEIFSENLCENGNLLGSDAQFHSKTNYESKRKCKSIFKEINRKCAEIKRQNSLKNIDQNKYLHFDNFQFNINSSFAENKDVLWESNSEQRNDLKTSAWKKSSMPVQDEYSPVGINFDFCDRLGNQLLENDSKEQAVALCKKKMYEKISSLNNILRGKVAGTPKQVFKLNTYSGYESDNLDSSSFNFVPHNEWVFVTPNKYKVTKSKPAKHSFLPGIVYRDCNNEVTDIIELTPRDDMTIDLTNCQDSLTPDVFSSQSQGSYEDNVLRGQRETNFAHCLHQNLSQQSQSIFEPGLLNPKINIYSGNLF